MSTVEIIVVIWIVVVVYPVVAYIVRYFRKRRDERIYLEFLKEMDGRGCHVPCGNDHMAHEAMNTLNIKQ